MPPSSKVTNCTQSTRPRRKQVSNPREYINSYILRVTCSLFHYILPSPLHIISFLPYTNLTFIPYRTPQREKHASNRRLLPQNPFGRTKDTTRLRRHVLNLQWTRCRLIPWTPTNVIPTRKSWPMSFGA